MKFILSHFFCRVFVLVIFGAFGMVCQKYSKTGTASNSTVEETRKAVIAFIKGDVVILRDTTQTKPVMGDALLATDTIITGLNGSVEILLGEDGVLKLAKNTSLQLSSAMDESAGERKTEAKLQYGKLVTILKKERKHESFNIITPTSIAGVRGTSFLTSVENPSSKSGGLPCGQNSCVVRYVVLDGSIAVHKPNSRDEIIIDKHKTATIGNDSPLSEKMIKPMDKQSLGELKEMLVFENKKMFQFESLSNELRSNSEELKTMELGASIEEVETSVRKKEMSKNKSDEVITTAKSIEESKFIQKDVQKDSLRLPAKESFDKK